MTNITRNITASVARSLLSGANIIPSVKDIALGLDSCVGFYDLTETSGTTAVDSTSNGNDGTYEGSPTLDGSPVALNGAGQFINLGSPSDFPPGNTVTGITVVIGHRPANGVDGVLLGKYATDTDVEYQIAVEPDGGGVVRIGYNGTIKTFPAGTCIAGSDSTTALWYDSTALTNEAMRIYNNGSLITSDERGSSVTSVADWLIGARRGSGNTGSGAYYKGDIYFVAVFDEALSLSEIQSLTQNTGIPSDPPDILLGQGVFDGGTITVGSHTITSPAEISGGVLNLDRPGGTNSEFKWNAIPVATERAKVSMDVVVNTGRIRVLLRNFADSGFNFMYNYGGTASIINESEGGGSFYVIGSGTLEFEATSGEGTGFTLWLQGDFASNDAYVDNLVVSEIS